MSRRSTRLMLGTLVLVSLGVAVVVVRPFGGPAGVRLSSPAGVPAQAGCEANHPTFAHGFADLKQQLGGVMGEPVECEHSIHVKGDTRQTTTTGYAYYRAGANVPTFTDGWDHWALTEHGLVHWTGSVVDPPTSDSQMIAASGGAPS